ncbi:MAG: hypothetical protein LCI03_17400 [Actinobacteria bacterium]|nr:hypothetical protein [Actinomycetota bacterium]
MGATVTATPVPSKRRKVVAIVSATALLLAVMAGVAAWRARDLGYWPGCPSEQWAAATADELQTLVPKAAQSPTVSIADCDSRRAVEVQAGWSGTGSEFAAAVEAAALADGWVAAGDARLEKVVDGLPTCLVVDAQSGSGYLTGMQRGC